MAGKQVSDTHYREYLEIIRNFKEYLQQMMDQNSPTPHLLLSQLHQELKDCQRCPLHRTRTNLVFGEGNPEATLMFVGEAPGKDEDLQARPFVGAAGKLLRKMVKEVAIAEQEIYIANILKCRPPKNRDPTPQEISCCLPYLKKQIDIINPKVICTLGKFSTQTLLGSTQGITRLRGKKLSFGGKTVLIPTYHPAACIYRPPLREKFMKDLRKVKGEITT